MRSAEAETPVTLFRSWIGKAGGEPTQLFIPGQNGSHGTGLILPENNEIYLRYHENNEITAYSLYSLNTRGTGVRREELSGLRATRRLLTIDLIANMLGELGRNDPMEKKPSIGSIDLAEAIKLKNVLGHSTFRRVQSAA